MDPRRTVGLVMANDMIDDLKQLRGQMSPERAELTGLTAWIERLETWRRDELHANGPAG